MKNEESIYCGFVNQINALNTSAFCQGKIHPRYQMIETGGRVESHLIMTFAGVSSKENTRG